MKKFTTLVRQSLALFLLLTSSASDLSAQAVAKKVRTTTGQVVPFLQAKPTRHDLTGPTRKYPMIIFLHGGGALQSNDTSLLPGAPVWNLTGWGPLREVGWQNNNLRATWNNKTDTFIVLQPLGPAVGAGAWPTTYVDAMIKYGTDSLKVDTNRIYLSGHSWGGAGVFNYLNVSGANAKKLAAAVPVSAWNISLNTNGANYVSAAKLPIWGFHAYDDTNTSRDTTINAINRLNAVNPQVKPLLTIWPAGTVTPSPHNSAPEYVFAIHLYPYLEDGVLNIYEWFLGQNNDSLPNILPVARVGNDTTILSSSGVANLNGSASTDADGTIVRYVWRKISGPAGGTIATPFGTASSTTVSGLTTVGVYKYQLNAVDNRAAIARDTLTITIVSTLGKAVAIRDTIGARIIAGNVTEFKNSSAFTVEAHFKYDPTITDWFNMESSIFRNLVTTTDRIRLHVDKTTNSVHFTVANGTDVKGVTASNVVSPNTWYHIAAVFDGAQTGNANRMKIYINGVSQTLSFTGTIPAITSGSTPSCIFAGEPSAYRLSEIDEVRAWDTVLTASTINSWKDKLLGNCHPNFNHLFLYWPLNNDTNPSSAAAALGTSYSSPIFFSNYVNSTQATAPSGCSGARVTQAAPLNRIADNKPLTGKIYPNPTEGFVQLDVTSKVAATATVNVIDMSGRYLYRNKTLFIKGNNRITVNIASLPAGTYIIEVVDGKGMREKYKVLKR
jgi:predicted esterase